MSENVTLSTNQRKAIDALLSEPTIRAAAQMVGVNERTVHRYLSDPSFKAELRRRQDELLTAAAAALVGLSGQAIETLRGLLDDKGTSASVKARVALGWLKQARETVELHDLADRLDALEKMTGAK